nr:MAG TPA: toxin [Caudoviricetes sp.]
MYPGFFFCLGTGDDKSHPRAPRHGNHHRQSHHNSQYLIVTDS